MIVAPYLSEDWKLQRDRVLKGWLNNDLDAFELLMDLNEASETWDDLVDLDKPVSPERLHSVFTDLMIKIPFNKFFEKHKHTLRPVLVSAILSWRTANELEKGTRSERAMSYSLRSVDLQILLSMIYIIRGHDAAVALGPEIYRTFISRNESIDEYLDKGSILKGV